MSKTCHNCNNVFDDGYNICPRCGMQYIEPEQPIPGQFQQPNNGQYGAPVYGQQPYNQPYGQPVAPVYPAAPAEQPMTVGQWVGTILLTTCLGTISLILLLVWAFSNTTPTAKKNYCRGMLIVDAIGIVLGIIFMIIFFALMAETGGSFFEELENALSYMSVYRG